MKTIVTAAILSLATLGAGCVAESPAYTPPQKQPIFSSTAPSFSEVDAALSLDSDDEAVVRAALADWDRDVQARVAEGKRPGGPQREMQFVAAVAPSLDNDQLAGLVNMMVERRDARREQMRERRGEITREQLARTDARRDEQRRKHRGAGAGEKAVERRTGWLDAALQLNDDQESRVSAALTTMAQARKSIRTARKEDSITREQAHEQMRAAHETLNEAMKTILTDEQETRLEILQPLVPGRHAQRP